MPLNDTLRAINFLMRGNPAFLQDLTTAENKLKELFPDLTTLEMQDLLTINIQGLSTYHTTIYGGEAKIIKNYLKISITEMENNSSEYFPEAFSLQKLLQESYLKTPWQGNDSKKLINNFCNYLRLTLPSSAKNLKELIRLEELTMLAKKHPSKHKQGIFDLSDLSVDTFMEASIEIFPCVQFQDYYYDVVQTYHRYYQTQETSLPEQECRIFAVCSRNNTGKCFWTPLARNIYDFLHAHQLNRITIEDFAHCYLKDRNNNAGEKEFKEFFDLIINLYKKNIITISYKNPS